MFLTASREGQHKCKTNDPNLNAVKQIGCTEKEIGYRLRLRTSKNYIMLHIQQALFYTRTS